MRTAFFIVLFFSLSNGFSQTDVNRRVADSFLIHFNNGHFEQIYNSFSPTMKRSRTKKQYFNFFSKVRRENGLLQNLKLYDFLETPNKFRGIYDGAFENENLTVTITTNPQGAITGLYIRKKPAL